VDAPIASPECTPALTDGGLDALMRDVLHSFANDAILWVCNYRVAHIPSHVARLAFYRRVMRFRIGSGSSIFRGGWFDARGGLKIGVDTTINQNCRLDTRGGISLGDNVSVSAEVCLLTADHDMRSPAAAGRARPVTVGDYVFIGTRAMILPGVTIGAGAAVAAGAVVTRDVAPYTIVAGVPAKPIGPRPSGLSYSASYRRLFC
jgi:acetyltransferase-like isoleucine patch superfamily enzyme